MLAIVTGWLVAPPIVLFSIAQLTASELFTQRYWLCAIPALALFAALAIRATEPLRARQVMVGTLTLVCLVGRLNAEHRTEDWRSAVRTTRGWVEDEDTPVLVRGGFIESHYAEWLADPERRRFLLAPLAFYRLGTPAVVLPYRADSKATNSYLDGVAAKLLTDRPRRFVLIVRTMGPEFRAWFDLRFQPAGYALREVANEGSIQVIVYERPNTQS